MAERLKNMFFTRDFIDRLSSRISEEYPSFDKKAFAGLVFDAAWEHKELKQRMRHITHCLSQTLPEDYVQALDILRKVGPEFRGFDAMIFPDYVECCGLDFPDLSLPALAEFTLLCSSEFAIRPFLERDPESTLPILKQWANDPHEAVRRLASEGCRPRLPWATALTHFKSDPAPIIPILEKLKDDESENVRRSVANNLNDISKDHPDVTLELAERWYGQSARVDRLLKHACRDLLKSGNSRAMRLFGFGDISDIGVSEFAATPKNVRIGESLRFSFVLTIESAARVRLEYRIDYAKSRGKRSSKIFQIREAEYKPGSYTIRRRQSFQDHSTRRHYAGRHAITLLVNGVAKATQTFFLK